jgi:hypothetical protein
MPPPPAGSFRRDTVNVERAVAELTAKRGELILQAWRLAQARTAISDLTIAAALSAQP